MQLEAAKILRRGRIRRTAEEGCERPHVPDIVVARLLDEVAHRHVFDHAPAQRADGLLTHRGAPVLRWRLLTPRSSRRDARPVTLSRSLGHSIGATGSAFARSALPRKRVRSLARSCPKLMRRLGPQPAKADGASHAALFGEGWEGGSERRRLERCDLAGCHRSHNCGACLVHPRSSPACFRPFAPSFCRYYRPVPSIMPVFCRFLPSRHLRYAGCSVRQPISSADHLPIICLDSAAAALYVGHVHCKRERQDGGRNGLRKKTA